MINQKKYTPLHRVLHWVMAIVMPILFVTGFLRMYWMSKMQITNAIASKTDALTKDQLSEIAADIRAPMWEWHEIFAKVMIVAFIVRIVYMVAKGIRFPNPFKANQALNERLQGFTYVYFYVFVAINAFTGLCIENEWITAYYNEIEDIHKWGVYWFPIFIILHAGGIMLAEISNKKGIASKMIGGD